MTDIEKLARVICLANRYNPDAIGYTYDENGKPKPCKQWEIDIPAAREVVATLPALGWCKVEPDEAVIKEIAAYNCGVEDAARMAETYRIESDDDYSVGWTDGRDSAANAIRELKKEPSNG